MKIKDFFSNLTHNRPFRWFMLAGISFIASVLFAGYNFTVGIIYSLAWNFSVSFYYLFLSIIKIIILKSEKKWRGLEENQVKIKRLTLFKVENIFLLLIDLALIAPISLLIIQEKQTTNMGMIPTIAVAAYTTYKIIMACVNYTRSKKFENLSMHGLKIISLKEAIVSIITLQNTMVVVFGDASEMLTLTTWTNIGMYFSLVVISIYQFVKLKRIKSLK